MVAVYFKVDQKRISEEIIREAWAHYGNADELEDRIPSESIFLKDIQENILDRFFNANKYILSSLPEKDIETGYVNDDDHSLSTLVYQNRKHLLKPEHIKRVEDAGENYILFETIEPLTLCYEVVYEVKIEPKGSL